MFTCHLRTFPCHVVCISHASCFVCVSAAGAGLYESKQGVEHGAHIQITRNILINLSTTRGRGLGGSKPQTSQNPSVNTRV